MLIGVYNISEIVSNTYPKNDSFIRKTILIGTIDVGTDYSDK